MSHKKLKHIASEGNKELRATFIARMAQYDALELAFIDEVLKDERTLGQHHGCLSKGKWAYKKQPFVHGRCISLKALLTLNGIVACTIVDEIDMSFPGLKDRGRSEDVEFGAGPISVAETFEAA